MKKVKREGVAFSGSAAEAERGDAGRLRAIGDRIAQVRGPRTRDEFARFLGCHRNTLGHYERGERPPDAEFVLALNLAEDVNPTWLLLGEGPERLREQPRVAEPPGRYTAVDTELLAAVIDGTERALAKRGLVVPAGKRAELMALVYGYYEGRKGVDDAGFERFIKLLVEGG